MTQPLGQPKHISLHWTAGTHEMTFPEYHFCVKGDGTIANTCPITEEGAHVWMRNAGNVGISLCAMAPGCPVQPAQREAMAKLIAEVCIRFGIDPHGSVTLPEYRREGVGTPGDRLVPTGGTITAPTVTDHAFFAHKDGYFPDRWDIGEELPVILGKVAWYHEKLAAGAIPFETMK